MGKHVFVTIDFPPDQGGVATYISHVCKYSDAENMIVMADKHGDYLDFDNKQNYKIVRKNFWPKWYKLFKHLYKLKKKYKIDLIHNSHVIPLGYITLIFKWIFGINYIIYLHGLDLHLAQKTFMRKNFLKLILKNAQFIVVNSKHTKKILNELSHDIAKNSIIVYPCPQDNLGKYPIIEDIQKKYANEKIILTVARLVKRKGHSRIIKLIPKLLEKHNNLRYIIVGDGPEKQNLIKLADDLNISDKIDFLGSVNSETLPTYYDLCDIFVMPNIYINKTDVEGLGIVFLEAGIMKKPVIGGNNGGVPEAIIHKQTGYLVDEATEDKDDQLFYYIDQILSDSNYAKNLGVSGYKFISDNFNWKKQVTKLYERTKN